MKVLSKASAIVLALTAIMVAVVAVGGFVSQVHAQPDVDKVQNDRLTKIEDGLKDLKEIPTIKENTEEILKRLPAKQ